MLRPVLIVLAPLVGAYLTFVVLHVGIVATVALYVALFIGGAMLFPPKNRS